MEGCETCREVFRLLSSYVETCGAGDKFEVRKKDVWTLLEFSQTWGQRQCSCLFKDYKNFERLNNLVQLILRFAINIIANPKHPLEDTAEGETQDKTPSIKVQEEVTKEDSSKEDVSKEEDAGQKDEEDSQKPASPKPSRTSEEPSSESKNANANTNDEEEAGISNSKDESGRGDSTEDVSKEEMEVDRGNRQPKELEVEIWSLEDEEKLLQFVAKVFQMNFPMYAAHKQYYHGLAEQETSSQESEALGNYCDMNDLDVPIHLLRNVCFFCDSNGLAVMRQCFEAATPDTLPFSLAHAIIAIVANLRLWLHLHAVMQFVAPLRTHVIRYLCRLPDKELRRASARSMADMMWSAIKEPMEAPLSFDRDSLELALKYFMSSTLTMRLAGLSQITSQIHMFNEVCNNESVADIDNVGSQLTAWLLEKEVVEHLFGPNMHLEIIKQCQIILNFLAAEGALTTKHIDTIWAATQLKHSGRYVHDLFPHLIKNLEAGPLFHLLKLVSRLHPAEHTEQTLYLSQVITKCIWTSAVSSSAVSATTLRRPDTRHSHHEFPLLRSNLEIGPDKGGMNSNNSRMVEIYELEDDDEDNVEETIRSALEDQSSHCSNTHEEESIDVIRVDSQSATEREEIITDGNLQTELRSKTPKHGSRGGGKSSHKTLSAASRRRKRLLKLRLVEEGSESSITEHDSDNIDSENEAMVTSPENSESDSDVTEESEEHGTQLGSEYEDVSEESDVEMRSEEEDDDETGIRHPCCRSTMLGRRSQLRKCLVGGDISDSASSEESGVQHRHFFPAEVRPRREQMKKQQLLIGDLEEEKAEEGEEGDGDAVDVEIERTRIGCEGVMGSLPPSPQSDRGQLPQEAQEAEDYYVRNRGLETEIYDCRRYLPHRHTIRGNVMDELISADEGSCSSSQASAKSEKNMADFDGEEEEEEDSVCSDELLQLSAHLSSIHHHHHPHSHRHRHHHHLPDMGPVYRSRLSSTCSNHNEREDPSTPFVDFNFEEVCKRGHTLLWDQVQDEHAIHLAEGLAAEAEKLLCSLVCWFPEREIRMKFVEGCLENLKSNRSEVVSLRLLPKLFGSFQQYRNNYNTHWITMWAEEELHMMELFFSNLIHYTSQVRSGERPDRTLYTHTTEVQARLQFLTCVFSTLGSPDHFRLTLDQVDTLWTCLATDPECGDEALSWFLNQAGNKDQHALGLETFKHIFFNKMPQLEPESISMTGLNLFTQLCSLARLASSSSYDSPPVEMPGIDHLWKIALRAKNTDVSLSAIKYINSYYINAGNGSLEKEEEFIKRCMESLSQASAQLDTSQDSSLLVLQRGLILLKTHLEAFRKRYAYHLRQWQLQGRGITNHKRHLLEGHSQTLRVVCQLAGMTEKFTVELSSSDLVADLRAEVTHISEQFQQQQHQQQQQQACPEQEDAPSQKQPPAMGFAGLTGALSASSLQGQRPVRMISVGHELTPDLDEKNLKEMGFCDLQLVFVSFGAIRRERKRDGMDQPASCLPPPPQAKLPMMLLLQEPHFGCLFHLLQQLNELQGEKQDVETAQELLGRTQMLSRNVWHLLMLLPTSSDMLNKFKVLVSPSEADKDLKDDQAEVLADKKAATKEDISATPTATQANWPELLDVSNTHKLLYSLQIVESLGQPDRKKRGKSLACVGRGDHSPLPSSSEFGTIDLKGIQLSQSEPCLSTAGSDDGRESWNVMFVESGGLKHLFNIFMSGNLEAKSGQHWNLWQQDCLACILKLINEFAIEQAPLDQGQDDVFEAHSSSEEAPHKCPRRTRQSSADVGGITTKLSQQLLELMSEEGVLDRLMTVLYEAAAPSDTVQVRAGYWVIHYAMKLLVSWAYSDPEVRVLLCQNKLFDKWLQRLVLQTSEVYVRREVCDSLYRLCEGSSLPCQHFSWALLSSLLSFLSQAQSIRPKKDYSKNVDDYGPGCRNYFWLLCSIVDNIDRQHDWSIGSGSSSPGLDQEKKVINVNTIARHLAEGIQSRPVLEERHNTIEDLALTGLLKLCTAVMKHNPPFKFSKEGQVFLANVFECLFAVANMEERNLPKCKSKGSRLANYDLLIELARGCQDSYACLHRLMLQQHTPGSHGPYPWQYWPQDDGRSSCGYVGLTNLGATCYMASCMQQLFMMPEARAPILSAMITDDTHHANILMELQRMFAFLQDSERKAYNPRSFCKVYTMDKQPLNTGEQKDMTEFFTDLISKMEEMTPQLNDLVSNLFKGELTNNVVSLDCPHVSSTTEEFCTVRCQVADMKNLYESLDEVTVKDTLEGDNMYTCSQCGKKVRAEKRACFKTLPKILSFNTMRYTFNMVTMMKEKVNTHFSFPLKLDMAGYTEAALMGSDKDKQSDDSSFIYNLIGVTVHTGTADGGHYYSFIKDRMHSSDDRWYMFNDAEVKPFDSTQLAGECFGGEMTTKTYDSVTDKYMDFSFEKTHSAYMLFYERCLPEDIHKEPPAQPVIELPKELAEWIWQDNKNYLRDRSIFDHSYMNFMWQVCSYLPSTLPDPSQVQLMASKLTTTFVLETLIHAREKPTMLQWMELMTKQFHTCQAACEWFLDYMANDDWWPQQILIKCPIQTCRQLFQRLCVHVIRQLRDKHAPLYLHPIVDGEDEVDIPPDEIGNYSCVTRFIKKLLSIIEHGVRPQSKHLTEYFSVLYDFAKIDEDEAQFLTSVEAISIMTNFYLGTKAADYVEVVSDDDNEDDEDEDDIISLTEDKYKPTSLEKMISLIAYLVDSSRTDRQLMLSQTDYAVLVAGKGFPFLFQQIRDCINLQQTRNLIISLTRFQPRLAEQIVAMIFNAIAKLNPEAGQPFFKILSMLVETAGGPPGVPPFTPIILQRIWEVSEFNPIQVLDWLAAQTPRNKLAHHWVLQGVKTWVEHFLLAHNNVRVRNAAAFLLISLVPDAHFRQSFRSARSVHSPQKEIRLNPEAVVILQQIYSILLKHLPRARHYVDASIHGTTKLVAYFSVLSHCIISRIEKRMFSQYFMDLWNLYQPKLSEPPIPCNHNKQAMLQFWYNACVDVPENVELIISNPTVVKHLPYNYILADHDDQEVVMFNRIMLPAYYGLLRLCCQQSPQFARALAVHQNMQWAFRFLTPYASQYPMVVDELFRMMKLFVSRQPDITSEESAQIQEFKRMTLKCYLECLERSSCWTTLISAFRVLLENDEDRLGVITYHGLSRLADAFNTLHMMYQEATACHVTGDLVELLSITLLTLQCAVKYRDRKDVKQSLLQWQERLEFAQKLLTLLNCYTPDNVRKESLALLNELVTLYPRECVQRLVPIILHAHHHFQTNNIPLSTGPYFPRRMPKPAPNKTSIRPLRPELQMFLHPSQLETSHGSDPAYDAALREYFLPYHQLVETLCHTALNVNLFTEDTINLSGLVALEGVPLQLDWFAKLWKLIYHSEGSDKTGVQLLCSLHTFHDYVDGILLDERTSFNNPDINSFFCIFFPKVYKQILCNTWESVVDSIICGILGETEDVDRYKQDELKLMAYKLNGDIRALLLMFSVVPPRAMNPHFPPALQHILAACRRDREARLAEVSRVQRSEPEVTEKEEVNGEESDRDTDSEAVPRKKIKLSPEGAEKEERNSPKASTKDQEKTQPDEVTTSKTDEAEQKKTRDSASPHDGSDQEGVEEDTVEEGKQPSSDAEGDKTFLSDAKTAESERPKSPKKEKQEARNETPSQDVPSTSTASVAVADSKEPVRRLSNSTLRQQNFVDVLARSIEQLMKCLEQAV
ncbi:ubiquitin carboxyl-terminal hydrolase 34-like isoform X1 [Asterias rubens]|uniref:ubiquitin carboxyl-terminal hydrolase 34-like isoform X1 n=1 Tax=Asterias rubens TaxID=7604 RepID=UPI001455CF10|nr:ubiquitin carboxyl-terminal hydrolase 34-like isoform X1 [Asterias rubens]